jgi:branched-chain amino acid aminotransferase
VTRKLVAQIVARELGLPVVERTIDRTELYSADENIMCGTGVGIAWLRSLDHRIIGTGTAGPVASAVARVYDDVTRGRDTRFGSELRAVHNEPALALT